MVFFICIPVELKSPFLKKYLSIQVSLLYSLFYTNLITINPRGYSKNLSFSRQYLRMHFAILRQGLTLSHPCHTLGALAPPIGKDWCAGYPQLSLFLVMPIWR